VATNRPASARLHLHPPASAPDDAAGAGQ
jgi:hypothetical protein